MKKFIAIILTLVIALSFSANVFAGDEPPVVIVPMGDNIPVTSNAILVTGDEAKGKSSSYSFENKSVQYSDDAFYFSDNNAASVNMVFSTDSSSHKIKVEIISNETYKSVYSFTASVSPNTNRRYAISGVRFSDGGGAQSYYIKMSDCTVSDASGEVKIY